MEMKELMTELETMKAALTTDMEAKADARIAEKLEAVNKSIEELKAVKPEVTADELKAVQADLQATIKAIDILQTRVKATKFEEAKAVTFADTLKEAIEASHDDIQKFIRKERKSVSLDIKAVADTSTSNVTGGTVWGAQYRNGIIMNPNAITHMRGNVVPVSAAGPGTDYYFMKENGAGEGSIAPTAEKGVTAATTQATGLKPQFDLDLIEASVKFEIIAGFMVVSKKAMNNIPNFISFLQSRIPEKLLDVEDAQILYGTGTSPALKGLLVSGNFTAGSAAGATVLAEKIINDISLLEDTYKRQASRVVLRPADFWGFFKNKASGSGEYDLPANFTFVNGVLYAAGVPVIKSTALTTNDYFIAADMAAELMVQDAMRLEFFEQDSTNVRTNQVTVRIEETVALPVFGSDYIIKGSSALS